MTMRKDCVKTRRRDMKTRTCKQKKGPLSPFLQKILNQLFFNELFDYC